MVSKYMLKKPKEEKLIERLGNKAIETIRNKATNEEMSYEIMQLSIELMQSGELCGTCSKKNNLNNCNACMNLGIAESKSKVIDNLKEAIRILEEKQT